MLGLSPRVPKFVKEFGKVAEAIEGAIRAYAGEVKARSFPEAANTYALSEPDGPGKAAKKPKSPGG